MANIARFRLNQTPEYLISVNTPEYSSDPDCIVNPDVSLLSNVPTKYWKRVSNTVVEMSAAEKSAVDAAEVNAAKSLNRSSADSIKDNLSAEGVKWRAFALLMLDELNTIRSWTSDFKAQAALATNFADLKARIAGLPTLSPRTIAQAKTAFSNRINDGSAD